MNRSLPTVIALILFVAACTTANGPPAAVAQSPVDRGREAAIAMPDRFSADAAEAVLRRGGNAVDAAVASAFVLAVTYPEAGNVGGGGFMLLTRGDEAHFLDYRETAPQAASRDMYLDDDGNVIEGQSLVGAKAAATPATVAGLWEAHRRFGSLPWAELLAPAVR
ncbi:MAG: gamma-glutamyltransferase, partial [Pseudomonadota bacterium]